MHAAHAPHVGLMYVHPRRVARLHPRLSAVLGDVRPMGTRRQDARLGQVGRWEVLCARYRTREDTCLVRDVDGGFYDRSDTDGEAWRMGWGFGITGFLGVG